ncbi:MAG: hypothetical protein ACPHK8_00695 [Thermoplasmatota archaeon]
MWQDFAMSALLAIGLVGTWGQVLDKATQVPRGATMLKGASALGIGIAQATLGLWVTAGVSLVYTVAFALLVTLRPIRQGSPHV